MILRAALLLVLVGACLLASACGSTTASGPPSASGGSQGATPAPGQIETLALDALSSAAAGRARDLDRSIGIAVYVPSQQRIYQYNAEPEFHVANAVKLPIMLTVMDRAIQQGRVISDEETRLIREMVTENDDTATTTLWNMASGAPEVQAFLSRSGIAGVTIDAKDWRESSMSAAAGALLMGKLMKGELLNEPHRKFALELLTKVDPVQDWGAVVAGAEHGQAGVANGWRSEFKGWVLASIGYAMPDSGPAYTVAVFTDGWFRFREGIQEIESIAGLVNNALLPG